MKTLIYCSVFLYFISFNLNAQTTSQDLIIQKGNVAIHLKNTDQNSALILAVDTLTGVIDTLAGTHGRDTLVLFLETDTSLLFLKVSESAYNMHKLKLLNNKWILSQVISGHSFGDGHVRQLSFVNKDTQVSTVKDFKLLNFDCFTCVWTFWWPFDNNKRTSYLQLSKINYDTNSVEFLSRTKIE